MSVGPLGNTAGLSGAQNDAANQVRRSRAEHNAERAESLGEADADQQASDRDADGRRIWEIVAPGEKREETADEEQAKPPMQSKDPTGDCGGLLDLTG